MIDELAGRRLDVDLLARELGNWRTSSASGPAYQGLADGLRMLIVDGRLPVGAQLPSERALADALRVSRTTVTAAYAQMRDDGYLNARPGCAQHDGAADRRRRPGHARRRRRSTSPPPPSPLQRASRRSAFAEAAEQVTPYLHDIGIELTGVPPLRSRDRRKILRAWASHRPRRDHGHDGCAARDRPDPGHLHPARRPGARRAAHLSRCALLRSPPTGYGRFRWR